MPLFFEDLFSSLAALRRPRAMAGAALAVVACMMPLATAQATDADLVETSGGQQQESRFLRLGIAKTAVVKLPAAAKDVIVGQNEVVDVVVRNRNTAYLFARTAGQTNVFFFDAKGQEILHLDLEVTLDAKALKKLLDRSIPGTDIQVDSMGTNVVLKGKVANAQEAKMAEDLANRFIGNSTGQGSSSSFAVNFGNSSSQSGVVNLLTIAESDQVMLQVKVVELKRSVLKQLGVKLDAAVNIGAGKLNVVSNPFNLLESILPDTFEAGGGWQSGADKVNAAIKAMEREGLATVLAEPTLTATSGAEASFKAGGEFPYRTCDRSDDEVTCDYEFKEYGVSLGFTPVVMSEGRIALKINTEVSELARFVDRNVPAIDTRKADTSVELPSGGSMLMAGLIKDVSRQELEGAPGLRSVPVLGALFSSRDYQAEQTELVVIVTPYISRPVQESQLATPLDRYNPATDLQQIFLGRLNRLYGTAGENPGGVYHGQVGHIVE